MKAIKKYEALQKGNIENAVEAKPFIKWAGGKSQLIKTFRNFYPQPLNDGAITQYVEPFLGGGAVFFDIIQNYKIQSAKLLDVNKDIINLYQVIQRNVEDLIDILKNYETNYLKRSRPERERFFYEERQKYNVSGSVLHSSENSLNILRAAQTIFLNKTCFNGLYRVNSKGDFNVPFGDYENPSFCNEATLKAASKVLSIADIFYGDYKGCRHFIDSNTFVYFDPPYRPISKTSSFKSYTKQGFNDDQQTELAAFFKSCANTNAYVMLSNSDPKNHDPHDNFFDDLYKSFNIYRIPANRMVNANAARRGPVKELIITNYKTANEKV